MSAKNILIDIATIGGLKVDDATQQRYVLMRINQAAEELYNKYDLIGSLREQVFSVENNDGVQITMPSYVGKIKAVRYYSPNVRLELNDMRPKYATKMWQSKGMLNWRLKGKVAVIKDITNASIVNVTFAAAVDRQVTVTIAGSTDVASQDSETLVFESGQQTQVTAKNWNTIESISKSVATNADCAITDIDDQLLAIIPNNQLTSQYQLIQILNMSNNTDGTAQNFQPVSNYVEVLWKRPFSPFVNLTDEFMCPDYDKAIFWQFMSNKALVPPANVNDAEAYGLKAAMIIKDLAADNDQTIEKKLNYGSNPVYDAFDNIRMNTSDSAYPNNPSPITWP